MQQNLTPAQTEIVNHMQECETAFSRKLSEREAATLFDKNNEMIDFVEDQNLSLPYLPNASVLKSLDQYKQILSQSMPKLSKPFGP
jgi:hypothetical protein